MKDRFGPRRRAIQSDDDLRALCVQIKEALGDEERLRLLVGTVHPADIADGMRYLSDEEDFAVYQVLSTEESAEVLDEVDAATRRRLVIGTPPELLVQILSFLAADEAADVLGSLPRESREAVLRLHPEPGPITQLLTYAPDSAGGIMTHGYVDVLLAETAGEALARFKAKPLVEPIFDLYVLSPSGQLQGTADLHTLLRADADTRLEVLVDRTVARVTPEMDQERVAIIFARYDLHALPVVDGQGRLLGVITADDVIDVVIQEADEDVAHISGTDAGELEKKSPVQIALMRMPWILATMLIELIAGFVIKTFDHTLAQVLLLASFMPIISAISGNTGLQSAAIIIRGLSTGHVQMAHWKHAVARQMLTTVILAATCGIALGVIGGIWYGKWTFGALVTVGMFASVNIAGTVGTLIPLLSKRLGFDPALTAGPFETAFQDVVGISIFLGMATLLLPYLK